jgi:hypothetical protein
MTETNTKMMTGTWHFSKILKLDSNVLRPCTETSLDIYHQVVTLIISTIKLNKKEFHGS